MNDKPTSATGLQFTEEMKGYVTFGELDCRRGSRQGKDSGNFLMFHLTLRTDNMDRFLADPTHQMSAHGWVEGEQFGGRLDVGEGVFNLFAQSGDPSRTTMRYRLFFRDGAGNPLTLSGSKDIHDDPGPDLWSDATTLYTRVLRGHVEAGREAEAEVSASGILRIYPQDFARQLTTFRADGPSAAARARALADFGRLFLGELWEQYAGQAHSAAEATETKETAQ